MLFHDQYFKYTCVSNYVIKLAYMKTALFLFRCVFIWYNANSAFSFIYQSVIFDGWIRNLQK
jgi:hypothetical protein